MVELRGTWDPDAGVRESSTLLNGKKENLSFILRAAAALVGIDVDVTAAT
jgi:hypothetical protein